MVRTHIARLTQKLFWYSVLNVIIYLNSIDIVDSRYLEIPSPHRCPVSAHILIFSVWESCLFLPPERLYKLLLCLLSDHLPFSGFIIKHFSNSLSGWGNIPVVFSHCSLPKASIHQRILYLIFIASLYNLSETNPGNLNCNDCVAKA